MKTKITATIIVLAILLSVSMRAAAGQAMTFTDVKGTDWFKPYIDVMSEKGICEGYGNGKYGPKDNLQVDQLIKMVVVALGSNPQQVTSGYWATPYINKAMERGIISEGDFSSYNRLITRGEIARIIAKGMKETYTINPDAFINSIKDYNKFSASSDREYILKVYSKGIVKGYPDGRFGPDDNATRAEASKMIVCMIDPSKRTVIDTNKMSVVNGFKIPAMRIIGAFSNDVEYLDLMVSFRYNVDEQYTEAENILKSKFNADFVKQIMDYAKKKKIVNYQLSEKYFYTTAYEVYVKGYGWSTNIMVGKK